MIHVVTSETQHLYGRQLDDMFRMRHAYYIEGHAWAGLVGQDGKEVDAFDDGGVVYLLSLDPWGRVAASVRLNPTTEPTLLGAFADHSDEPLPSSAACWDISRWIADPVHRRSTHGAWPSNHQRELIVGMLEFAESRGVTHFTMLSELRLAERVATYGWPVRCLGAPRDYEGGKGTAVAAEIRVGPDILALTRQKTGVFHRVLFEAPPAIHRPAPELSAALTSALDACGVEQAARLVRALADQIAAGYGAESAAAIELVSAIQRILESAGASLSREDTLEDAETPAETPDVRAKSGRAAAAS
ncbi:N-acyl-L-homoserine lactone synthetase-like protein [bacterium]|nr:N-acyl-L-homoserine lactone synthetase-like protein [bacterium]